MDSSTEGNSLVLLLKFHETSHSHFENVAWDNRFAKHRNHFPARGQLSTMPTVAEKEWRLIREQARPGPLNMALDEVAAETAASEGVRTARVYSWEPSTLSLGYHQDPNTINWDFCEREGITVTRRPTGGGAIYHDAVGDISYSIVAPADELPSDLMDTYELLCQPLMEAFERLGVDAYFAKVEEPAIHEPACYLRALHPAHDVLAGDGRKISGNAQYRQRDAVIQHGSITFSCATDRHLATFTDPPSASAFKDRVTSVHEQVDATRQRTIQTLEAALQGWADIDERSFSAAEIDRAETRAARKYENDAWVIDRDEPATSEIK
jgi:lipoate-protein ligase A